MTGAAPWEILASAIVLTAIRDWRRPCALSYTVVCGRCERRKGLDSGPCADFWECEWKEIMLRSELAAFFMSARCVWLIGSIDPQAMRKALGVEAWVRRLPRG